MRLDAWMRQDHSLGERLHVVERLCQAVNAFHTRGEALSALDPTRIELTAEGECDLSAARQGSPAAGYAAPDAGGDASPELADVYSVGAITWEVLAGRSAGDNPAHLFKVRSDLPRELADAVMACLEGSADWRPKDLTYLAQMTAAKQQSEPRPKTSPRTQQRPTRPAPTRPSPRRGSSRTWPLLGALVVVIGLGGAAAWSYLGAGGTVSSESAGEPAPTQAPPTTVASATDPPIVPPAPSGPAATPAATARPIAATPAPATPAPVTLEPVAPPSTVSPAPRPTATPPPTPVAPEPRVPTAAPEPAVVSPPSTTTPPPPDPEPRVEPPAPPAVPAVLNTVSPLEVKRPGKVMLDLRGSGFRPEHRAQVLSLKKAPRGITVIGQKVVNESLITVLIELDPNAETGEFAIAVEDSDGTQSAPAIFKVNK